MSVAGFLVARQGGRFSSLRGSGHWAVQSGSIVGPVSILFLGFVIPH